MRVGGSRLTCFGAKRPAGRETVSGAAACGKGSAARVREAAQSFRGSGDYHRGIDLRQGRRARARSAGSTRLRARGTHRDEHAGLARRRRAGEPAGDVEPGRQRPRAPPRRARRTRGSGAGDAGELLRCVRAGDARGAWSRADAQRRECADASASATNLRASSAARPKDDRGNVPVPACVDLPAGPPISSGWNAKPRARTARRLSVRGPVRPNDTRSAVNLTSSGSCPPPAPRRRGTRCRRTATFRDVVQIGDDPVSLFGHQHYAQSVVSCAERRAIEASPRGRRRCARRARRSSRAPRGSSTALCSTELGRTCGARATATRRGRGVDARSAGEHDLRGERADQRGDGARAARIASAVLSELVRADGLPKLRSSRQHRRDDRSTAPSLLSR